jgi:hypothetical protein
MAFAGLRDAWKKPTCEDWLQSLVIVAAEANGIGSRSKRALAILHYMTQL